MNGKIPKPFSLLSNARRVRRPLVMPLLHLLLSIYCCHCYPSRRLAVHWGNCSSHNSAATYTLKQRLKNAKPEGMNMKMDDRVRDGRKEYPSDAVGTENMAMIFYFKGRASDVAQYQKHC